MNKIVNIQVVIMFKQLLSPDYDYFGTSGKVRECFNVFSKTTPQLIPDDAKMMPPEIPRFVFNSAGGNAQMSQHALAFSNPCNTNDADELLNKLEEYVSDISRFAYEIRLNVPVRFGIILNGVKSKEKMLDTIKSIINSDKQNDFTTEESEIAYLKKFTICSIFLNRWTRLSFDKNNKDQIFLFDFNTDQTSSISIDNANTFSEIYAGVFAEKIKEAFNEG